MDLELELRLTMVGALLGLAGAAWWVSRSEASLRRAGRRFVRQHQVSVEERFVPAFNAAVRRRERFQLLAALLAVPVVLLVPMGPHDVLAPWPLAVLVPLLTAAQTAFVGRELARTGHRDPGPRVARLRDVRLGDYVPWWSRVTTWASLAAAAVVVIGLATSGVRTDHLPVWITMLAAVAAALTAIEVVARRLCSAPEPALDRAHLYWQDAVRSDLVNQAYQSASSGVFVLWLSLLPAFGRWALIPAGLGAATLFASLGHAVGPPWFRRRLWPQLGPFDVLQPGRPVAS